MDLLVLTNILANISDLIILALVPIGIVLCTVFCITSRLDMNKFETIRHICKKILLIYVVLLIVNRLVGLLFSISWLPDIFREIFAFVTLGEFVIGSSALWIFVLLMLLGRYRTAEKTGRRVRFGIFAILWVINLGIVFAFLLVGLLMSGINSY